MELIRNALIGPTSEQSEIEDIFRVLWINPQIDLIILFNISSKSERRPASFSLSHIKNLLKSLNIKIVEEETPSYMLRQSIPESELKKRDIKWSWIEPLINTEIPGEIFFDHRRGAMIAKRAADLNIEKKTLYLTLYRFWRHGQSRNTLLENREKSGGKGKVRIAAPGVRLGRPPKQNTTEENNARYSMNLVDIENMKRGYALFAQSPKHTLESAHRETINKFYFKINPTNVDERKPSRPGTYPSINQFRHHGEKAFDKVAVLRGKLGDSKFEKNYKRIIGQAHDNLWGAGHRYEIDATIADIHLVSISNRSRVIGRPVVYSVTDTCTRMFVGIYIGLSGPSWDEARQALFNAFTEKVSFCESFGISIEQDEWPCHHLPREVTADRGEIIGLAAESMVEGIDVNLTYCPPSRPDLKPVVESHFKVMKKGSRTIFIPGAIQPSDTSRGLRDPRLDATLNIHEFTQIIIRSVLHHNKFARNPELRTQNMIADNVASTPIAMWTWSLKNDAHQTHTRSKEQIYASLLPKKNATVTRSGIKFNNLYYFIDSAAKNHMFALARLSGVTHLEVFYDCFSAKHIWIQDEDKHLLRCTLRGSDSSYSRYRTEEVEDTMILGSYVTPEERHEALYEEIVKDTKIQDTVKKATNEKNRTSLPTSKSQKISNIRENRTNEKEIINSQKSTDWDDGKIIRLQDFKNTKKIEPFEVQDLSKSMLLNILDEIEKEPEN